MPALRQRLDERPQRCFVSPRPSRQLDPSGFILCSNEELWNEQDKLVEQYPHLKNAELQKFETACGQRCEPLLQRTPPVCQAM